MSKRGFCVALSVFCGIIAVQPHPAAGAETWLTVTVTIFSACFAGLAVEFWDR